LYLEKIKPGARLFVVGTQALEEEFRNHGFELVQENPMYVVLGFDTGITYQKLWKLCNHVRRGVPYIATHADLNCPVENGQMPDAGAVMAFVLAATGCEPDVVIGKPNRFIVEAAARKMDLPVEALGMVGDRLYTDIALGQTCGITTVLVLSGETKQADLEGSPFQPDAIFSNIGKLADWLEEHEPG
jgi:HAD superfamily hydrolase (TIGR01450 family)